MAIEATHATAVLSSESGVNVYVSLIGCKQYTGLERCVSVARSECIDFECVRQTCFLFTFLVVCVRVSVCVYLCV